MTHTLCYLSRIFHSKEFRFYLVIVCLCLPLSAMAQSKITGKVIDTATGETLIGATVQVKGTGKGTITDIEGNYSINASSDDKLIFSSIGYITQEVSIGKKTIINVNMITDTQTLDEVVVIGYGSQSKRDITGAIGSINNTTLERQNTQTAAQALIGQIAGLSVVQTTGNVGVDPVIEIRGMNSIDKESSPLIVIDGVFGDMAAFSALNPSDIAKVDVLKDASSTAIYGSMGANGVVLVTTKSGSEGKNKINYSGSYGIRVPVRIPKMMNAQEFAKTLQDATDYFGYTSRTLGPEEQEWVDSGNSTDWLDLVLCNGVQTQHTLSLQGGNKNENHYISLGYSNQEGNIKPEKFERYSLSGKINAKVGKIFEMGAALNGAFSENKKGGNNEIIRSAFRLRPTGRAFDDEGNRIFWPTSTDSQIPNILYELDNSKIETMRANVYGNVFLSATPLKGLTLKSSFMPSIAYTRYGFYMGQLTKINVGKNPAYVNQYNSFNWAYVWDNTINYNTQFKSHKFNIMAGYSVNEKFYERYDSGVKGLTFNSLWHNMGAASELTMVDSDYTRWTVLSYLARINYSFKDRYLLTLTGRYDGASNLAPGHKWQFFPSAAIAWRISEEEWMKRLNIFDNLKLRLSYGTSGNNNVAPYSAWPTLTKVGYDFDGTGAAGYTANLANKALTWEKSDEINVGLDFGILGNRISATIEFYNKKTSDLILKQKLPIHTGYDNIVSNIGAVRNRGIEITLNTVNIKTKDWSWVTNINFTRNRNKILELYGDNEDDIANQLFIGQPIKVNYAYKYLGIWQEGEEYYQKAKAGQPKVLDVDQDNAITADKDMMIIGTPFPKWIGGMTNTVTYKNFDLSITAYARYGEQKLSWFHNSHTDMSMRYNVAKECFGNYWTPDNPNAEWWAPGSQANADWRKSKLYMDCSFLKISNITLGYEFSKKLLNKIGMTRLRVYATVQNPFTITKYNGFDPEWADTAITGLDSNSTGFASTTYTFGVNIGF